MSSKKVILFSAILLVGIICLILILNFPICADCGIRQTVKSAKLQLREFSLALKEYKSICGNYPSNVEGLETLAYPVTCLAKSEYQFIKKLTLDPWDRKWIYTNENDGFKVMTLGADGVVGGEGSNTDLIVTNKDSH